MSNCFNKLKKIIKEYITNILVSNDMNVYSAVSNNDEFFKNLIDDNNYNEYKLFSEHDENNLRNKVFNNVNDSMNDAKNSCPIIYEN